MPLPINRRHHKLGQEGDRAVRDRVKGRVGVPLCSLTVKVATCHSRRQQVQAAGRLQVRNLKKINMQNQKQHTP